MSSKAHPPPVPPANRTPQERDKHGMGGADPRANQGKAREPTHDRDSGTDGVAPNTHHQGYQQDR
ncbi:hypothetical protein EJV46_14165 [Roseococcus sp. SYP-B2431]|nr:hypothetical protein EJV46_14165 [Roseococcus sp. SYP-B2431]